MRTLSWIGVALMAMLATSCEYEDVTEEIGYKGKARLNPWLAAERFCRVYTDDVESISTWSRPDWEDAMWLVPAGVLTNESYTGPLQEWVDDGGHLVILLDYASGSTNDWNLYRTELGFEPALEELLRDVGLEITSDISSPTQESVTFLGEEFDVEESSVSMVKVGGEETQFASVPSGYGRITVVTDARIFRNRWIGEKDHAALLKALIDESRDGRIVILKSGTVSLWRLLTEHLWPVLVGLGVLIVLWLWRSFSRFGPIEATEAPSKLRGYDHHLEALGDFQWRLDKGVALLRPLRDQIVDRGQQLSLRRGRRDDDFFEFLADISGLPRQRVERALAEPAPADSAILIRTTADLQRIIKSLH